MDLEHLDAVTTLAALNFRALASPETGPHERAALLRCDDVLELLQNVDAGDLVELGAEGELDAIEVRAKEWMLPRAPVRDRISIGRRACPPRRVEPAHGPMSPRSPAWRH